MSIKYAHPPSPPFTRSGMDPSPRTQKSKEVTYFSTDLRSISWAMTVKNWDDLSPGPSAECLHVPSRLPAANIEPFSFQPSPALPALQLPAQIQLLSSFSHLIPLTVCPALVHCTLWNLGSIGLRRRKEVHLLCWHLHVPLFPRAKRNFSERLKPPKCGKTQNPYIIIFFLGKLNKLIFHLLIRKRKPRELLPRKT